MLNRYTYARNNPIIYTDPTGNFIFSVIVGAIIGALAAGIQSDWSPKAMAFGALFGAVGGGAGSTASGLVGGGLLGAIAGGAAAGATVGGLNAAYYGGDVGQGILRGAGFGALGGLAYGAVDKFVTAPGFRWEAVRVALTSGAGGGLSELSGGEFWEGVAFSSAIAGSRFIYRVSTTVLDGGNTKDPTVGTCQGDCKYAPKSGNTYAHQDDSLNDFTFSNNEGPLGEGGIINRTLSKTIPGLNDVSHLHDIWTGSFTARFGSAANLALFNVPTMPPAAAVTYLGAAHDPSQMATFELHDREDFEQG